MNRTGDEWADGPAGSAKRTNVRWTVLAWLCSFSAITYLGRIGIIQVQDQIQWDLHLTPAKFALAFSSFSLAYAFLEVPSGWLGDKLGPRKMLLRIALFWIAFTMLTGLAWGLVSLIVFRFFFGAGEAGSFPNIGRASREWFPFRERGLTQGLVWLSARWGGAISPLLMMIFAYPYGWRGGFIAMGLLGAAWFIGFRAYYRDKPQEDPRVNAEELAFITGGRTEPAHAEPLSWRTMMRSRTLWLLSLMYFCSNAGWSFFASWITPYLRQGLHLSGLKLVLASGGPLLFGGIACLVGGRLTDRQVQMWGRRWGRTLLGIVGYGLGGVFMLLALYFSRQSAALAFSCVCLSSFVKDLGLPASWSTTIDIGQRYSGTVGGFMNTVGNLGQMISIPLVAQLAMWAGTPGHPKWSVSLYYYAAMFFVASAAWIFVDPRKVIVYAEKGEPRPTTT